MNNPCNIIKDGSPYVAQIVKLEYEEFLCREVKIICELLNE
jgi:hypothetical protein